MKLKKKKGKYFYCPEYSKGMKQRIVLVEIGIPGYRKTKVIKRNMKEAYEFCNKLNKKLGFTQDEWENEVNKNMQTSITIPLHD